MIPKIIIEKILDQTRIEEVIEEFIPLRKSGVNYKALCPFHQERTPSFTVSPHRGMFYCFGCKKGGNAITFLMEHENMTYPEAVKWLGRKYGVEIEEREETVEEKHTSAILGFVNTLEEVLKKENPSHIGVAFDPSGPTFRHEAFEQYKAQREETPEAIRLSVPIIKDIIHAYRIPILEVAGYEADDVIGTLATEAGRQGITTYMLRLLERTRWKSIFLQVTRLWQRNLKNAQESVL